ncbi:MAG: NAD(P)/FAD-dependent oxidoreductase [Myxococcota bacterium]|nr:NAD(P)/FAD-dependent oxidoreductase [Myxococcota bacterium]
MRDFEVVIVGTGFSGIGAAIKLRETGCDDFVVLEKAEDIGGTWRDNSYPGLAVDMPSFIYSYPFEMRPDWSRVYAPAGEIKDYADSCVQQYGIRPFIRFGAHVVASEYDEAQNIWRTRLASGEEITSRYLVSASGLLYEPKLPDIEGLGDFDGKLIHSANWDYDYDLAGKRVAIIGTGATAVQLIPAIVDQVGRLDVYQRTAIWLMSKPDAEISPATKRWFRRLPFLQRFVRFLINVMVEVSMGLGFVRYKRFPWIFNAIEKNLVDSIRSQIKDPELQEKLIPKYSFFCKRPSFSNEYYPAFNRDHVELVTDSIERITRTGIATRDGTVREVDLLICATGYSVFDRSCAPNFEIIGREGKNLGDFWQRERFQAYEGASVPGFPNLFLMMGPYSAAGASYFTMIDTQTHHLTRCLREARRRGANCIEVEAAAHERDFEKVKRRHANTALFAGNCAPSNSYYFDAHGDAPGLRPVTGLEHWLNSRFFPLRNYRFESRGVEAAGSPPR